MRTLPITAITLGACIAAGAWADDAATVKVPVPLQPVGRGAIIEASQIAMQVVPSTQVYAGTVKTLQALVGQQALRPLPAGRPVNSLSVRVPPAVEDNQAVTIRYVKGGIELTGKGQALQDGQLGQSIKVLNPDTRTTIVGTVQAPGVVQIN